MLVRRYELRDEPDALFFRWTLLHGPCARMTEFLLLNAATLDIASWPLHKNDSQDLRCFFFFERYRGMACTRMTRTNQVFPCEELAAPCSRMTRTNRVARRIECEESMAPAQGITIRVAEKISLTHAQGDTQF